MRKKKKIPPIRNNKNVRLCIKREGSGACSSHFFRLVSKQLERGSTSDRIWKERTRSKGVRKRRENMAEKRRSRHMSRCGEKEREKR